MIVVDASVVATALGDDDEHGAHVRARLEGQRLVAPELLDLEVLSVWRRAARSGGLPDERARQALDDLAALPLVRVPHTLLVRRIWELRDNLSAYDAAYVALAEALNAQLLTGDRALFAAPGTRCTVTVIEPAPRGI